MFARAQIAATIEASYPTLALQSAANLLFFKSGENAQLVEFGKSVRLPLFIFLPTDTVSADGFCNPRLRYSPFPPSNPMLVLPSLNQGRRILRQPRSTLRWEWASRGVYHYEPWSDRRCSSRSNSRQSYELCIQWPGDIAVPKRKDPINLIRLRKLRYTMDHLDRRTRGRWYALLRFPGPITMY